MTELERRALMFVLNFIVHLCQWGRGGGERHEREARELLAELHREGQEK